MHKAAYQISFTKDKYKNHQGCKWKPNQNKSSFRRILLQSISGRQAYKLAAPEQISVAFSTPSERAVLPFFPANPAVFSVKLDTETCYTQTSTTVMAAAHFKTLTILNSHITLKLLPFSQNNPHKIRAVFCYSKYYPHEWRQKEI